MRARVRPAIEPERAARLLALALSLAAIVPSAAQAPAGSAPAGSALPDAVAVASVSGGDSGGAAEARSLAGALGDAAARELAARGFRPFQVEAEDRADRAESALAAALAAEAGTRWTALAACYVEGRRLAGRLAVYDAEDGALVAAETGSAFAGASALAALDAAAEAVAGQAQAARERTLPEGLVNSPLAYASEDEGALLRLGGPHGPAVGAVQGGRVTAPYLPFREGQDLVLGLTRDGYWPITIATKAGTEPSLPRLMPKTRLALILGASPNRLAGLAAEFRYYPLPDSLYGRLGLQAWLRDDGLAGSPPSLHAEGRLGGAAYLILPPGSRLRLSAGLGAAALMTVLGAEASSSTAYLDLSLELPALAMEWHWPGFALVVEQRFGYSLGLDSGLVRRGWWRGPTGPLALSLGAMITWP